MADAGCAGADDHVLDRRNRRMVRGKAISVGCIDPGLVAADYVLLRCQAIAEAGGTRVIDKRTRTRDMCRVA